MKFDVLEKETIIHGDVKSNAVSIDTNNINFIVTILSTNLYSKPIESFIRETVSNAWDSHVEAGVSDPVVLELGVDTENKYFCRIQDFGVGLSPERFDNVYRNIGSSTKRDSNNQIGGFGIGRFSALAYSDVVYITSNYESVQYKYIMYKDGNSISIDLMYEQETDERNGVQVQVPLRNSSDIASFYTAIKQQLVYFENLYFVDNTQTSVIPPDEFNNFHIKKYDTFLVNDLDKNSRKIDLVLGKVRYPLRVDALTKNYPQYVSDYPISLKFEIGDLEVTPNREEILYSQKNIDKIETVLNSSIEILDEIFDEYSNKDFNSLSQYMDALQHSHQAPLLTVDDTMTKEKKNTVYVTIPSSEIKITLNGKEYPKENFLRTYEAIYKASLIPYSYELSYTNRNLVYVPGKISLETLKSNFHNIYIADISSFNNMTKLYIREEKLSGARFINITKNLKTLKYFYRLYLKHVKDRSKSVYGLSYDENIIRAIMAFVIPNANKIQTFKESDVPKSFIDRKKAEEKAKRALRKNAGINWSENINFYQLEASKRGYKSDVVSVSKTNNLKDIKNTHRKLTIIDEKSSPELRALFNITNNCRGSINTIEIAPTRMKLVTHLQNFVKLEDFMDIKYKIIRQIGTAKLIEEKVPHLKKLATMSDSLGKISEKLKNVVSELNTYSNKYISERISTDEKQLIAEIYSLCQEKNYFDEQVRATLDSNLAMLQSAEALLLFSSSGGYSNTIPNDRINLAVDYILARRLFRPDVKAVFKLKEETIFNKKKDESN